MNSKINPYSAVNPGIRFKQSLFRTIEFFRKEPVLKSLKELEENQEKNYEEMKTVELLKLRKILKHAYENVRFYKNQFDIHGISLERITSIDDIKTIPLLTKDIVRRKKGQLCSTTAGILYSAKTSGSTGQPLKFYRDRIATSYAYAAMFRGLRWYGLDFCDREAYLWGIPISKRDRISARGRDFVLNRFRQKKFNLSDAVNHDFYKKIVTKNPMFLSGYGSLIYEFAKYIYKQELDIAPVKLKLIKYTAEMMFDYQKAFASELFSCPIVSEYGSAEVGIVAFQCPAGGNHVLNDCVCLEFVKDPLTDYYRIIVTNLNSYGFPFIRYDTGDLCKSNKLGKCSCGLPFPIMDSIIGRTSDIILTPEGKRVHSNIFSYILKELLKDFAEINQLRFIQTKKNRIKVEIFLDDTENTLIEMRIRQLIRDRVSPQIILDFVKKHEILRDESGKLRYFVSELNDG